MRVVFSVISLLVVVFVVMKLAATQLKSGLPVVDAGAPAEASSHAPARPAAQAVAEQMQQALAQGAAARASEAGQ